MSPATPDTSHLSPLRDIDVKCHHVTTRLSHRLHSQRQVSGVVPVINETAVRRTGVDKVGIATLYG